ncbi:MAG: hypothetical protein ACT4PV_06030 [Planctomycetaceae bacterium]
MRKGKWILPVLAAAAALVIVAFLLGGNGYERRSTRAEPGEGLQGGGGASVPRPLEVRIVSAEGGTPVAGASVALRGIVDRGIVLIAEGTTDETGRVRLEHREQAGLVLEVRAPGFVGALRALGAAPPRIEFALERLGAITCLVVDARDRPLAATVRVDAPPAAVGAFVLLDPSERPATEILSTLAGATGACRFDALPPAAGYRVTAQARGWSGEPVEAEVRPGAESTVRIVLEPAGTVSGRFLSAGGAPLEGGEARAYRASGLGWVQTGGVRIDAQGRFLIAEVPAGRLLLQLEQTHGGRLVFAAARVEIAAGEHLEAGDIRATSEEFRCRVVASPAAGVVRSRELRIVVFVAAGPRDEAVPFASAIADAKLGDPVTLAGLPDGPLKLTIVPADPALARREILLDAAARRSHGEVEFILEAEPGTSGIAIQIPALLTPCSAFLVADRRVVSRYAGLPQGDLEITMAGLRPGLRGEIWIANAEAFLRMPVSVEEAPTRFEARPESALAPARLGGRARHFAPGLEAVLLLAGAANFQEGMMQVVAVDAAGRFRFEGVPPATSFDLLLRRGAKLGPAFLIRSPDPGGMDETLVLDPP